MNLPADLLAPGWLIVGWAAFAILAGRDARLAPWSSLAIDNRLNVWLGAIVSLLLLWTMQAVTKPGLNLHLLGATVLVLAFGRALATLALAIVLAASTFNGGGDWSAFGINAVVFAALPAAIAQAIAAVVPRVLPAHVFVFIFVSGFFGAGVTLFLTGVAGLGVLALSGAYPAALLVDEYLPSFLLLGFAEAWLSGMVVTLLVVYRPDWIAAFPPGRRRGGA